MELGLIDFVIALSIGLGLAAASGFRVFLPPMMMSGGINLGWIEPLGELSILDGWTAFSILAAAVVLEIGGYMIPWVDNLLDIVATPAAAIAGVLMMGSVMDDYDPMLQWTLSIVAGGSVAGTVQTGTVAIRALSLGTTGGLANPLISILEAMMAVFVTILVILAPLLALLVVVFGLIYAARAIEERREKKKVRNLVL
tara:strand:+ start:14583 stop:15176 length:594 start_codon:yes stop_codon:yes gene_type:complete